MYMYILICQNLTIYNEHAQWKMATNSPNQNTTNFPLKVFAYLDVCWRDAGPVRH